jgi:hypothetical protein
VKHRRDAHSTKFANVAVLEGDQVSILDQRVPQHPECPSLVTSLFGFDSAASWIESADVLVQLAVSMRAHGRGGALVVVPTGTDAWRESVITPVAYAVHPPFAALAELVLHEKTAALGGTAARRVDTLVPPGHDSLSRLITIVAGLTAVDGATLISDRYDLMAFGAKLTRRSGWAPVERSWSPSRWKGASRRNNIPCRWAAHAICRRPSSCRISATR